MFRVTSTKNKYLSTYDSTLYSLPCSIEPTYVSGRLRILSIFALFVSRDRESRVDVSPLGAYKGTPVNSTSPNLGDNREDDFEPKEARERGA